MHHIFCKNSLNMTIKSDIDKTFDRVIWTYIQHMLHKFDVLTSFIHLLMKCVTITDIAIRFNNTRTFYFKPTKGLRQGDLLSHLLFIIVWKVSLPLFIMQFLMVWWTTYSLRYYKNPQTHIAFADDFTLFTKATPKVLQGIRNVISSFVICLSRI